MLHRKKKAMEWLGETGKWTYGKKHLDRAAKRIERHQVDAGRVANGLRLPLLQVGVQLHLVHSGLYGTEGKHVLNALSREVGDTDGVKKSRAAQLLHLAPRLLQVVNVVAETVLGIVLGNQGTVEEVSLASLLVQILGKVHQHRLVNEEQIDVVQLQLLEADLHALLHVFGLPLRQPQLRRDEQLLSLHDALVDALLDRIAHGLLIGVGNSRINETVAVLDCCNHGILAFLVRSQVGSRNHNASQQDTQDPGGASYIQS